MAKKIKAEDLPYRPCVGIMVLNHEGLVWAGKRISNNDRDEYKDEPFKWQMPQGGIDKGEDPKPASLRELYEETGIKSVEYISESKDWLTYDLPEDLIGVGLKGKYRGQTQKWVQFRLTAPDSVIDITYQDVEFSDWRWMSGAEVLSLIVPFKRPIYQAVLSEFGLL